MPVGIQNAPELIGVGLSPGGIAELARRHANFTVLKGEGPATLIARVVEETEGKLAVFNGRGGLELPDNLRAGCAGLIPAPDCFEAQVRIYEAMRRGDEDEAERIYRGDPAGDRVRHAVRGSPDLLRQTAGRGANGDYRARPGAGLAAERFWGSRCGALRGWPGPLSGLSNAPGRPGLNIFYRMPGISPPPGPLSSFRDT